MRERLRSPVLLLLSLGCAAFAAVAQTPGPPREITVVVQTFLEPVQPVQAARVQLAHLDNLQPTVDAQRPTNSRGEALLLISRGAAERGDLRIVISGAGNLVVYEPADGQLATGLGPTVNRITIKLLPKGTAKLLEQPGLAEVLLHRMSLEIASQQKEITRLKTQASAEESQKPDLGKAIAEWAVDNGFTPEQIEAMVQQWAQGVERQPGQSTEEQKALAELALNHYASAAPLFNEAGDARQTEADTEEQQEQALQSAQRALVEKQISSLQAMLEDRERAAGAYWADYKPHQATQTLESAEAVIDAKRNNHPDDRKFRELWLRARLAVAHAHENEGDRGSMPLLDESVREFQSLQREYAALGDREAAATAQLGLADALWAKSDRTSGKDKEAALFNQGVQALGNALRVFTRADRPQKYAEIEDHLGLELLCEGEFTAGGDRRVAVLGQAAQAYRNALRVYSETNQTLMWALAQEYLGDALDDEGKLSSGEKSIDLFEQSAEAYQNAIQGTAEVQRRAQPYYLFGKLATALVHEGERSSGDKATALFERAIAAFQNQSKLNMEHDLAQGFAYANLGDALRRDAEHSIGRSRPDLEELIGIVTPQGVSAPALLDQAVWAYQGAVRLEKRGKHLDWAASTEIRLGHALADEGECARRDKAVAFFDQAAKAYESALQDDPSVIGGVAAGYHDRLFRFDRALELEERRTEANPSALRRLTLAEGYLTMNRFADCLQQAEAATDGSLEPEDRVIRDTLRFACQRGTGDRSGARATERVLLQEVRHLSPDEWDFTGTNYFLTRSPIFEKGRKPWIALFTAVQNGDSAGMTAALHQLEPILQQ
jgi:hypothetical protein